MPTGEGHQVERDLVQGVVDGRVSIWYEDLGSPAHPVVLLIMGQGADATAWDDEFCGALLAARYRVVRFDNRDAGLSGDSDEPDYTIADLAADAARLLDRLGIGEAHIVGQSMGGMIAQQLAIDVPGRVASLAILSSSSDPSIAPPDPAVLAVAEALDTTSRDGWVDAAVNSLRLQTGSRWEFDEDLSRRRIEAAVDRAFRPEAGIRQVLAILRSPPRTSALRNVNSPALVLHGSEDPVLPVAHAVALADAIPGARLVVIDGMGHAVSWGHWDVILEPLLQHLASANRRA
jgi:pimeloyl-ACP methyl ester carboxylesterase